MNNNGVIHAWGYGIYDQSDTLVMVVDLDGAFYHGDNCDYDGIHCKEEYDEKRAISVAGSTIKVAIINELAFQSTFENMMKSFKYLR